MADEAKISMTAQMLPNKISKLLTGLTVEVAPQDANDKWFWDIVNVSNSSGNIIAGVFVTGDGGHAAGAAATAISNSDKVKFLFIKNTGTTDGSTATSEAINICFDGGTAAYDLVDGIEIGTGEVWFGKLPNTTVDNIHAVSVDSNMAHSGSAGEGNVQCLIFAIIDDV